VDTHRPRRRLFGRGARDPHQRAFRERDRFEPLIGHSTSAVLLLVVKAVQIGGG
jgi:hypothetical protein